MARIKNHTKIGSAFHLEVEHKGLFKVYICGPHPEGLDDKEYMKWQKSEAKRLIANHPSEIVENDS